MAESKMKTLNALHNPDMLAGGNDIVAVLWGAQANNSLKDMGPNTYMNVNLHRCK